MNIIDFVDYVRVLFEFKTLNNLLKVDAFEDSETKEYLNKRSITKEMCDFVGLNIFAFKGSTTYKGREYNLDKSIVVPLKVNNQLIGVWVRSIFEKRFYIWMINNHQKFWIPDKLDRSKPAYVCESIFDAVSLAKLTNNPNVTATLGVSIARDMMDNLNDVNILALDNDRAGLINMEKYLKIWSRWGVISYKSDLKDFNEILINKQPLVYENLYGIRAKVYLRSQL